MFQIMGIGVGEGGGRLAMSMVSTGTNIGAINTNKGDLAGLPEISESKKLLLNISAGGSGRDPNFVREAMKTEDVRNSVTAFMKKLLSSTPLFAKCTHCGSNDQILDKESIGDTHQCSYCHNNFGITALAQDPNIEHDYIFLFVCLGGGSGSGLIVDLVEICLGLSNKKGMAYPVGVVCTLPSDTEDMATKNNAISIFTELYNLYAKAGLIAPLILVDNQKMFENFNLPLGAMYPTINRAVTGLIHQFNKFSDQTSTHGATMDTMNTARLWSLEGCCSMGKFVVGNPASKEAKHNIIVPHPLDLGEIEDAMKQCTFVDGFDLGSAKGAGIIAVAPEYYFADENVSTCIKYAFGKTKEIIGADGLIFTSQLVDNTKDYLEFYITYNGLSYPKERFDRMQDEVREGRISLRRKQARVDDVPYDTKLEQAQSGQAFKRLQNITGHEAVEKTNIPEISFNKKPEPKKQPCNNCYPDPITKKSTGVYRKGGPAPFSGKICPICKGNGTV